MEQNILGASKGNFSLTYIFIVIDFPLLKLFNPFLPKIKGLIVTYYNSDVNFIILVIKVHKYHNIREKT